MNIVFPEEVVIDRSKWVCGDIVKTVNGNKERILGSNQLLNSLGNKCCLGFSLSACGVPDDRLLNRDTPKDIAAALGLNIDPFATVNDNCGLSKVAVGVNDNDDYTQEYREKRLTELFAESNVKLRFVGKFPKKVAKIFAGREKKIKSNADVSMKS